MKSGYKNNSEKHIDRRKFLKYGILSGIAARTYFDSSKNLFGQIQHRSVHLDPTNKIIDSSPTSEILYNGIALKDTWPPKYMNPDSYDPMPLPYLSSPPEIILIETGRQLFIDDFLIEYSNLNKKYHQPVKYEGNPILQPSTRSEMNDGFCPMAAPFSDGCFYDPIDKCFKLWYMAGWFDGTALATSIDGIHWTRSNLNVVHDSNLVLIPHDDLRRDGASVWLDHETKNAEERYKMYLYARQGKIGDKLLPYGAFLLTSPDGLNWKWGRLITGGSDNNTFFYNPFRKKWIYSLRKEGRPIPPWANPLKTGKGRARSYWESDNFQDALNNWDGSVFWFGADRLDVKRSNYFIGDEPQIYKVDAVGYESIMLGLIQVHYGPSNEECAKGGFPKLTELQVAFSRDGFHWDRTCRETFIGAHPDDKSSWERAYIHSVGGVCNIVGDKLHFYYTAFRGNESNRNSLSSWSGMYSNASTGLAILRRDGFASMETDQSGILLTKTLIFKGKYFFVNVDSKGGSVACEICNIEGKPYQGFSKTDCVPVEIDSTKVQIKWKTDELEQFSGKNIRIKFYLEHSKLYAFWVSQYQSGSSSGSTAAGGPGLNGTWDI